MYYIQDSDYETAAKNGISRKIMWQRVYAQGWQIKEASTVPVRHCNKDSAKYKEIALQNGVSGTIYAKRLREGMKPKQAAETPPPKKKLIFTKEELAIAASNGISEQTARYRHGVYLWSKERAITEPVHINKRKKTSSK